MNGETAGCRELTVAYISIPAAENINNEYVTYPYIEVLALR
jgi:hypothetical protein